MKITCTLSAESLRNAADQLRKYADSLPAKTDNIVRKLGECGTVSAIKGLGHYDTGDTVSSIQYTHRGNAGTISAGGAAVWIEFGTGVVANKVQAGAYVHEKAAELGMSAIGTYGKGHGADLKGWWYPGDDGKYHHTFGIASNQFMYEASQIMRSDLLDIAKEVFKID